MITDKENMGLSGSLADYLEAIFQLERSNRVARAKDIASLMKVQRASVTGALKTLATRGFVNYSPYRYITLTPAGRDIAKNLIRRYMLVNEFFTDILHLSPEAAEANARRIDHAIDQAGIDKLARFLEFFKACPRTGTKWLDAFDLFCGHGPCTSDCRTCFESCMRGPAITGNRTLRL